MRKILIIEPDHTILKDTSAFLGNKGFDVIETKEGTVGVQKALEFLPDLILCDAESSGLNGYEVFNTLQQINTTAIIPFIFIKNSHHYEDIKAVMRLGADDYIVKPYDLNDLLNLVQTRLEKQERLITIADEKFNTLMEFSSNGIFIFRDGKLSYVNRRFCEIVSYQQSELLGMNLVNIVYKDDMHMLVERVERCLKGIHKDLQADIRLIGRDQELVQTILTGSCVNIRGKKSIIGSLRLKSPEVPTVNSNVTKCNIKISKREHEIIQGICDGLSNAEIADRLNISERTVEGHRANLLRKTNCKNSVSLAIFAVKHGLYQVN